MLATVATRSIKNWQPNGAAVWFAALASTLVVAVMFIFLFDRQLESPIRVEAIQVRLTNAEPSKENAVNPAAAKTTHPAIMQSAPKPLHIVTIKPLPSTVIEPLSPPIDWRQQIEMSVNNQVPSSLSSSSPALKNLHYTPLYQALNALQKPAAMQNGGYYRDSNGNRVMKAGGMCFEIQKVQFGPSPSDTISVAMDPPFTCPGDYKPTMADDLSKWADQKAKKHLPP